MSKYVLVMLRLDIPVGHVAGWMAMGHGIEQRFCFDIELSLIGFYCGWFWFPVSYERLLGISRQGRRGKKGVIANGDPL